MVDATPTGGANAGLKRANAASKYKGVFYINNRWRAQACVPTPVGLHRVSKTYDDEEDAARRYDEELTDLYYGGLIDNPPHLNFPEEYPDIPLPSKKPKLHQR